MHYSLTRVKLTALYNHHKNHINTHFSKQNLNYCSFNYQNRLSNNTRTRTHDDMRTPVSTRPLIQQQQILISVSSKISLQTSIQSSVILEIYIDLFLFCIWV